MDNIAISLYSLAKNNNGNFKSEKQRAFLTSKFGKFCAKDEYIVNGSGMGVAKSTTWIDTFKLSEDRSKIVSIHRSYLTSKGAKDRYTWEALKDDDFSDKLEAKRLEKIEFIENDLLRLKGNESCSSLGAYRESIRKNIDLIRKTKAEIKKRYPNGIGGISDEDFRLLDCFVGYITENKEEIKLKWQQYKEVFGYIEKQQNELNKLKS